MGCSLGTPPRRGRIDRRAWLWGAAATVGLALAPTFPVAPAAGGRSARLRPPLGASVREALRFFDTLALVDEDENGTAPPTPGWVRKWTGPVGVRLSGPGAAKVRAGLTRALARISSLTGLPFTLEETGGRRGNVLSVEVASHAKLADELGPGGNVCACATYGESGRLHTGHIVISERYSDCLWHELMHALGFDNHWWGHGVARVMRSVLAPRATPYRARALSAWDELAIRTLYDGRLEPRMPRRDALPVARVVVAEILAGHDLQNGFPGQA